jgi:hypothetical protein
MALPIQTILIRQLAGYLGEPLFLTSCCRPARISDPEYGHQRRRLSSAAIPHLHRVNGGGGQLEAKNIWWAMAQGRRASPSRDKQEPAQRSISPAS